MAERIVRTSRGDIDVERSSLSAVIRIESGYQGPTCEECGSPVAKFLDPSRHAWDCPQHPRLQRERWLDAY